MARASTRGGGELGDVTALAGRVGPDSGSDCRSGAAFGFYCNFVRIARRRETTRAATAGECELLRHVTLSGERHA